MPRVVKKKDAALPKKGNAKKKNGYMKPKPIPMGEILTDTFKKQWKIGPSIGSGGFGEIYSATHAEGKKKNTDDYEYVVKIEPHENGPLFVEMHFYMRNAKIEDITNFCKQHNLKSLGMPHLLGTGSHEIKDVKHRFVVMPRYGKDIWSHYLTNKNRLPEHTVYRIAIQMMDVYEYIHGCTYVHGDLKGANILLGLGKNGAAQAYLVDFGLASHYTSKAFKPDPKRMHNGTIEYTSRDAHNGVPTMRGDLEILGYNIIAWLGVELPWEKAGILDNPVKVQKAKEDFMTNLVTSLKGLFNNSPPKPIAEFMKYVSGLDYDQVPDYDKCRKFFKDELKKMGKSLTGDLDLKYVANKASIASWEQDSDFENEVLLPKTKRKISPVAEMPSRKRSKSSSISPSVVAETPKRSNASRVAKKTSPKTTVTPKVSVSNRSSAIKKLGKTIVNDNLTPTQKSSKTYEFNFELDVSVDADVIVNINRRKRTRQDTKNIQDTNSSGTSVPRANIRKLSRSPRKKISPQNTKNVK